MGKKIEKVLFVFFIVIMSVVGVGIIGLMVFSILDEMGYIDYSEVSEEDESFDEWEFIDEYDYSDWKWINVENCGRFGIPGEWDAYEKGDLLYIVDENSKPVYIETKIAMEENPNIEETNEEYTVKSFQIWYTDYCGGGNYGRVNFIKNGEKTSCHYIQLGYYREIWLVACDESTTKLDVELIANTFESVEEY